MVKVCKDSQMETFTKVFMHMANPQDSESITGPMEATLKDHSKQDSGVDKEYGKKGLGIQINIKESI